MTFLGAIAIGLVVHAGTRRLWGLRWAAAAGCTAALVAAAPSTIPLVGLGWIAVLIGVRRAGRVRRSDMWQPDQLGQVLYIALSSGLPVMAALEFAAGEVDEPLAGEVRSVLRVARRRGLAAALTGADGPARRLFGVLARAQVTGSSAVHAIASYVDEDRKQRRARAREAAQRLPVKLTIPLALLILPGFVLLTVGPTVIATVQRLFGRLVP